MNEGHIQPFDQRWILHQRRNHAKTLSWDCARCPDRRIFLATDDLWQHCLTEHLDLLPDSDDERQTWRANFEAESLKKRPTHDDSTSRKPAFNESTNPPPEVPHGQPKRPLSVSAPPFPPPPPTGSLSALGALKIGTPRESDDFTMQDSTFNDGQATPEQPRKRAALASGISQGSASPFRESPSPPPRRSKARPTSAPHGINSEGNPPVDMFAARPHVAKGQLWSPEQDSPLSKSSVDRSNIASLQAQKNRNQAQRLQSKPGGAFQSSPHILSSKTSTSQSPQIKSTQPGILNRPQSSLGSQQQQQREDSYDIKPQPETRPISQEQLVAEVKGIYAGLVMVEAKCIEVDNKQATLAQADQGAQPRLNNEQWQALIALHRTLLHEHHDFFLASQHPSASPALQRLASKYAMPARMWRHGIHSFLELLRHRLPASLDHMLAFIYLAYSMMALLYETVPAFKDTWIECLGDLARYRMAIEDDDIRDREVWTGVARHWYSKASDKAPTTGRLYHHLAILARPNALQQLFYYSKSLCVDIPFTSARESILTLFEPVLNSNYGKGQFRLPPLDTAFVKAHGLLFTNKDMERFEPAVHDFLGLLDNQIGRVTRKFTEQGYHISIANCVAMLGFASKSNVLMQAISSSKGDGDATMASASEDYSALMASFRQAEKLTNSTLEIVLQRIGDPNVLPFIHTTLVFIFYLSSHPGALSMVKDSFPWELLSIMLNTLRASYTTPIRIEEVTFPLPEKDEVRPLPEDYAMRGLLWTDDYFPSEWFMNEKIDEDEKFREVASMAEQRRERILWLGCRAASLTTSIKYDRVEGFSILSSETCSIDPLDSRTSTFASATTMDSSDRTPTWGTTEADQDYASDHEDLPSTSAPS